MTLRLKAATAEDASELAAFHSLVNQDLARKAGSDRWSKHTANGLLFTMKTAAIYVVRQKGVIIGALNLSRRKPWAIDTRYFADCAQPLYLTGMAVHPTHQRKGIGRLCLEEARMMAMRWPSDAIRLDAYDNETGAGEFYRKCGFTEVGRVKYRDTPLIYFEMLLAKKKVEPAGTDGSSLRGKRKGRPLPAPSET